MGNNNWYDYPPLGFNAYQVNDIGGDTPHFAYDLQTPFHTEITAPLSGTVKIADYKDWGGEIFVQPDDSNYPEYYFYHPDEIDVSVGSHVDRGQILGLSGGENPGYPGAEHPALPTWSSGPHTHVGWFTGWKNVSRGRTVPYGPDTASLISIAKGSGGTLPLNNPLVNNMSNNSQIPGLNLPSGGQFVIGLAGVAFFIIGGALLVSSFGAGSIAKKMLL